MGRECRSICDSWDQQFLSDTCWQDRVKLKTHQKWAQICWPEKKKGRSEFILKQAGYDQLADLQDLVPEDLIHSANNLK